MLSCASTQPRPTIALKASTATPMAIDHIRIRPQSPMLTMSATAPMVQKWVRCATAPNTSASANANQSTCAVRDETSESCMGLGDAGASNRQCAQACGDQKRRGSRTKKPAPYFRLGNR